MSESDSKRARFHEVPREKAIEDRASDERRPEAKTPRRATSPKAAVVPLGRAGNRRDTGGNRSAPPLHGPDDDDPGPAAA